MFDKVVKFANETVARFEFRREYGISKQGFEAVVDAQLRINDLTIPLISRFHNWQERRGIYRVPVHMTGGLVALLDIDRAIDIYLKYGIVFFDHVYIHVYEDGYNHKVGVSYRPDKDFAEHKTYFDAVAGVQAITYTTDVARMIRSEYVKRPELVKMYLKP